MTDSSSRLPLLSNTILNERQRLKDQLKDEQQRTCQLKELLSRVTAEISNYQELTKCQADALQVAQKNFDTGELYLQSLKKDNEILLRKLRDLEEKRTTTEQNAFVIEKKNLDCAKNYERLIAEVKVIENKLKAHHNVIELEEAVKASLENYASKQNYLQALKEEITKVKIERNRSSDTSLVLNAFVVQLAEVYVRMKSTKSKIKELKSDIQLLDLERRNLEKRDRERERQEKQATGPNRPPPRIHSPAPISNPSEPYAKSVYFDKQAMQFPAPGGSRSGCSTAASNIMAANIRLVPPKGMQPEVFLAAASNATNKSLPEPAAPAGEPYLESLKVLLHTPKVTHKRAREQEHINESLEILTKKQPRVGMSLSKPVSLPFVRSFQSPSSGDSTQEGQTPSVSPLSLMRHYPPPPKSALEFSAFLPQKSQGNTRSDNEATEEISMQTLKTANHQPGTSSVQECITAERVPWGYDGASNNTAQVVTGKSYLTTKEPVLLSHTPHKQAEDEFQEVSGSSKYSADHPDFISRCASSVRSPSPDDAFNIFGEESSDKEGNGFKLNIGKSQGNEREGNSFFF